jgi:hypothetical protein
VTFGEQIGRGSKDGRGIGADISIEEQFALRVSHDQILFAVAIYIHRDRTGPTTIYGRDHQIGAIGLDDLNGAVIGR